MENNLEKKETKKVIQEKQYIKLNEVVENHLHLVNSWKKIPVTFSRVFNKKGLEYTSIFVNIEKDYMNKMILRNFNDRITQMVFMKILLKLRLPLKDKKGYYETEWTKNAPVRFITGKFSNANEEDSVRYYKAMQVIFAKDLYFTHLFNRDEIESIEELETQGKLSIDWEDSTEQIKDTTDTSSDDDITLE